MLLAGRVGARPENLQVSPEAHDPLRELRTSSFTRYSELAPEARSCSSRREAVVVGVGGLLKKWVTYAELNGELQRTVLGDCTVSK